MLKIPRELLKEIENHLQVEKDRVLEQIEDLSKQDPFTDTDRLNDNAASDAEANEENNHDRYQAMLLELKQKLSDIEATFDRIAKGTYGFCTQCKNMIDTDRLAAIPTATLCMQCESKAQK